MLITEQTIDVIQLNLWGWAKRVNWQDVTMLNGIFCMRQSYTPFAHIHRQRSFSTSKPSYQSVEALTRHFENTHLTQAGKIPNRIIKERKQFLKTHDYLQDRVQFIHAHVYSNRYLWDPFSVDSEGNRNFERMREGKTPILLDGSKAILHHLDQTHHSVLIVLPIWFHEKYYKVLHSNLVTSDPVIRRRFDQERRAFWMMQSVKRSFKASI